VARKGDHKQKQKKKRASGGLKVKGFLLPICPPRFIAGLLLFNAKFNANTHSVAGEHLKQFHARPINIFQLVWFVLFPSTCGLSPLHFPFPAPLCCKV